MKLYNTVQDKWAAVHQQIRAAAGSDEAATIAVSPQGKMQRLARKGDFFKEITAWAKQLFTFYISTDFTYDGVPEVIAEAMYHCYIQRREIIEKYSELENNTFAESSDDAHLVPASYWRTNEFNQNVDLTKWFGVIKSIASKTHLRLPKFYSIKVANFYVVVKIYHNVNF